MKNDKSAPGQEKEWQDSLQKEDRIEENIQSPFEQARKKLEENPLHDEADLEQQQKEAMRERD